MKEDVCSFIKVTDKQREFLKQDPVADSAIDDNFYKTTTSKTNRSKYSSSLNKYSDTAATDSKGRENDDYENGGELDNYLEPPV